MDEDDKTFEAQRRKYRAAILSHQARLLRALLNSLPGRAAAGSVALLFAVLVLIQLGALTPGSAADWLAAGGAIFAAVTALNIATKDRRERAAERYEADFAQMRLVQLDIRHYADSSTPGYNLRVTVTNHGSRPILDVRIQAAILRTYFGQANEAVYRLSDPPPQPPVIGVVPHIEQQILLRGQAHSDCQFILTVADDDGKPYLRRVEHLEPYTHVEIACYDAEGTFWLVSNKQAPYRPSFGQSERPQLLRSLWEGRRQLADQLWLYFKPTAASRRALLRAAVALVMALAVAVGARWLGLIDLEALIR